MAPRVLYFCPCTLASSLPSTSASAGGAGHADDAAGPSARAAQGGSGGGGARSGGGGGSATVVDAIPPLPCYDGAASYSHFSLSSLYFCEECDQLKCPRCVTAEVSSYYCSVCLFDVQAANVKADRNRCSRSCFLCPSCSHSLQVVGTVKDGAQPAQQALVQGEAPFFLTCTFCKWDSKEIGMTFQRSAGLALQLQEKEEQSPDVLELEHLIEHFDAFYRAQGLHAAAAHAANPRHQAALSAAAKSSKLLRDVPILSAQSHARYLHGASAAGSSSSSGRYRQGAEAPRAAPDDVPAYRTVTSYVSGRDASDAAGLGVRGRLQDFRERWLSQNTTFSNTTTLSQKRTNPADQPVRVREARPTRAPLRTKLTKRCADCAHILVRPDVKAAAPRYKIKLVAVNFLPDIHVAPAPVQASSAIEPGRPAGGNLLAKRPSMVGIYGSRRSAGYGRASDGGASLAAGAPVDSERLQAGRTYSFECTFSNPLEDAMRVRIAVVKPAYTMGNVIDSGETESVEQAAWQVAPTTSHFALAAASLLNLEDEDELLGSGAGADDEDDDDEEDVLDEADEDELSDGGGAEPGPGRGRSAPARARKRRDRNAGVLRKAGNTTTIGLDVVLGKEAAGDIEVAMRVTFSYEGADDAAGAARAGAGAGAGEKAAGAADDALKSFTFWTAVRLGYCVGRHAPPRKSPAGAATPLPPPLATEGLPAGAEAASTLAAMRAVADSNA